MTSQKQPTFTSAKSISDFLEEKKITDIVVIDLKDKSSIADTLIIGTGTSLRHIQSTAEHLRKKLKEEKSLNHIEGDHHSDWVILDAGDHIVHLFTSETRSHYDLEKMWGEYKAKDNV
ncbi:MAG: ribosome silencing factor [Rickettsiales bacterium]|nr:ribosome silencing factor [Rickettsiales bacterium]|tara:strand:+ start:60472 stop:60825 length:354 start_codon:yes stop_codon:yes gene_type:complete